MRRGDAFDEVRIAGKPGPDTWPAIGRADLGKERKAAAERDSVSEAASGRGDRNARSINFLKDFPGIEQI
jgi:hypothetical protein